MTNHDDASLLDRYARKRDPEAFAALVERHAGLVFGTCLRQCGDRGLAEDASQESFLALAAHAAEIRQSVAAWLHTVALHAASRLGRARREQRLPAAEPVAPEVMAVWRELEPQLDLALAELPEEVRSAVILRFLEGQTQQQVATILGLSQATVSRRIASGIAQLRRRLAQHWDDQTVGGALSCAVMTASPALVAHATKIGMVGLGSPAAVPAALMPSSAALLIAAVTLVTSVTLLSGLAPKQHVTHAVSNPVPPMPVPSVVAGDDAAPLSAPGAPGVPITICVHGWPLDRVVDLIDDQLPSQTGVRLELMPVGDYPIVDLRCDAMPLPAALDHLVAGNGWRWRSAGTVCSIDRPMPAATKRDLLAWSYASAQDLDETSAQSLATSGDLDACAELVAQLADPRLDALAKADPSAASSLQTAVLNALSLDGGSWQTFVPRGNPLSYLANIPAAQHGLVASWQRSRRLGWPITFFQCYLAGELRATELGPQLLELVNDPGPFLPGIASKGLSRNGLVERLRHWGEHALGRMGYQPAVAPLIARLPHADAAEMAAVTSALGELQDPAAVPALAALSNHPWSWFWGVTEFTAMVRLCQTLQPPSDQQLVSLIKSSPPIQWALGDSFVCYPTVIELPDMCKNPANDSWWNRHGFWKGTGRLSQVAVHEAVAHQRLTAAPSDAMLDDALLARGGDDAALERVVQGAYAMGASTPGVGSGILAPGDGAALINDPTLDIASALAGRLSPTRGDRLAKHLLDVKGDKAWTPAVLSLLSASHLPEARTRLIADFPSASSGMQDAILRYLADERSAAGRFFIISQCATSSGADRTARALHWHNLSDPSLRSALNALPMATGGIARACNGLELYPDSTMRSYEILRQAHAQDIGPEVLATLATSSLIRSVHSAYEQPLEVLVLHWFSASTDPAQRAACCAWLDHHMTCDVRPLRGQVLSAVITALPQEKDAAAAKSERLLLSDFLAELTDNGDGNGAFYHEDVQMGGGWDDLGSIAKLDGETIPAAHLALNPPEPVHLTPPPASNF